MLYPTRAEMREFAAEIAEAKISALLQAFAMPSVDEEMIRKLLVDTVTNTFVAGFAAGWDASTDASVDALRTVERFHPRER